MKINLKSNKEALTPKNQFKIDFKPNIILTHLYTSLKNFLANI